MFEGTKNDKNSAANLLGALEENDAMEVYLRSVDAHDSCLPSSLPSGDSGRASKSEDRVRLWERSPD